MSHKGGHKVKMIELDMDTVSKAVMADLEKKDELPKGDYVGYEICICVEKGSNNPRFTVEGKTQSEVTADHEAFSRWAQELLGSTFSEIAGTRKWQRGFGVPNSI